MIRFFIAVVIMCIATLKGFTQKNIETRQQPQILLRFNPLGLIDPFDQNLSLGIERRFPNHMSIGTDAAYIFSFESQQNYKAVNGLIARPFIRYYPNEIRKNFFEAELHYKYVAYKIEDWLGREPVNNVPTYEEFTTFNLQKHAVGLHLKAGFQENLSRNKKLRLEYAAGLGIRYKWNTVRGGIYTRNTGFFFANNNPFGVSKMIVMPIIWRLLYVIK